MATGSSGTEHGDGGSWRWADAAHRVRWSERRGWEWLGDGRRLEATASTRLLLTPSSEKRMGAGEGDDKWVPGVSERGEWRWVGSGRLGR